MFSSSIQSFGDNTDAPDYVYYNADIINNTTANTFGGVSVADPQIRFNETRDAPIIRNAEDYYFSIIRFTMNGANRDLPLFIPVIAGGTGQTNQNLTVYTMAVPMSLVIQGNTVSVGLSVQPQSRPIVYQPETQNPAVAPLPRSMANQQFQGLYDSTKQYLLGQIVSMNPGGLYGAFPGPFYQVASQSPWSPTTNYITNSIVQYNSNIWTALVPNTGVAPTVGATWALGPPPAPAMVGPLPQIPQFPNYWVQTGGDLGQPQDLTSRYYWVYTYQHWMDLWNETMLNKGTLAANPAPVASNVGSTCCFQDTYNALYAAFLEAQAIPGNGLAGYDFPYPDFQSFCGSGALGVYPPVMTYEATNQTFPIYGDSRGFGERMVQWTPIAVASPQVGIAFPPSLQLFFNTNMFNLFANYDNTFYNIPASYPDGYTNQILFVNKAFTNYVDYRVAPYVGVAPLGYFPTNPDGSPDTPSMINRLFCVANQDYSSVDSMWSPISSIVFTSTLLPVKTEAQGAPNVLGTSNTGFSSPTAQSAFQPIITDISLDTSQPGGNDLYRKFIYYAPSAEYRLSDFQSSKQPINNIDIQVYWKNRLDSQLYPITMTNLSSVSIKVMFKRKGTMSGAAEK